MTAGGLHAKGWRTIDFIHAKNGGYSGGLGISFQGLSLPDIAKHRSDMLTFFGCVDRQAVTEAVQSLEIGGNARDSESIAVALDDMSITEHRAETSADKAMKLVSELLHALPEAIKEANGHYSAQSRMAARARVADYKIALEKLRRAAERVEGTVVLRMTKQDWHDDALYLACQLLRIADREKTHERLSFKSPNGPTTRCLARLLELGGVKKPRKSNGPQKIDPDMVRHALIVHPQRQMIGLP